MKLWRIRTENGSRPTAVDVNSALRDLSSHIDDLGESAISADGLKVLAALDLSALPVRKDSYAPILRDVRRLFCIGLNYHDHAAEMNMPPPSILFCS